MNYLDKILKTNNPSVFVEQKQQNTQPQKQVETKKDGKKLLAAGVIAAATIGIVSVLIAKGKVKPSDLRKAGKESTEEIKNQMPKKVDEIKTSVANNVDGIEEIISPKIKDLKFDKGIAFKDGEKFTGIIEDTLKSGKKVVLEYKDGVIQKSTNNGVEKVFDHKAIKKISQNAKDQHDKLSKILADKDNLSLEDFTKQVDDIKFKSKNDLEQIRKTKLDKEISYISTRRTLQQNYLNTKKNDGWRGYKLYPKDDEDTISIVDKAIEAYDAEIKYKRFLGEDCSYAEERFAAATEYRKNIVEYQQKIKDFTEKFNDDQIKDLYTKAIQGNQEMSDIDYEALKKVYANKFELDSFRFITLIGGDQIDNHHSLHGDSEIIRKSLRDNNGKSPFADKIDEKFAKLMPTKNDCVVYRGEVKEGPFYSGWGKSPALEVIEKANIGDRIIPNQGGYSYTAFHRRLAEGFAGNGAPREKRGILYEIRIPKGAKVSRNLEHGGEVIMPRDAEYKLISKGTDPHGYFNVVLEYILPKN